MDSYNDYEQEIKTLLEEIAKNPKSKAFIKLGNIYLKLNMIEESVEVIKEGLRYAPDNMSAVLVLAKAYKENRQFNESAKLFEKVITKDSQNLTALLSLAEIKKKQGNFEESYKLYDSALFLDPMNEDSKRELKTLKKQLADIESEREREAKEKKKKDEDAQRDAVPEKDAEGKKKDIDDFIIQHSSSLITFDEEDEKSGEKSKNDFSENTAAEKKEEENPEISEKTDSNENKDEKIENQKDVVRKSDAEIKSDLLKQEKHESVSLDESLYVNPSVDPFIKKEEKEETFIPYELPGAEKVVFYSKVMADIYTEQGRYEQAIEVYQMLLRQHPDDEKSAEKIRLLREEIAKQEFNIDTGKIEKEKKNKSRAEFVERLNKSLSSDEMSDEEYKKAEEKFHTDKVDEDVNRDDKEYEEFLNMKKEGKFESISENMKKENAEKIKTAEEDIEKTEENESVENDSREMQDDAVTDKEEENSAVKTVKENKPEEEKVETVKEKIDDSSPMQNDKKEENKQVNNGGKSSFTEWVKVINQAKEKKNK